MLVLVIMKFNALAFLPTGAQSLPAVIILAIIFSSCCTQKKMSTQYPEIFRSNSTEPQTKEKNILSVQLLGDPGCKSAPNTINTLLTNISEQNTTASKNVTLVLGDNIYPAGATIWTKGKFTKQIEAWQNADPESQIIYMPGNHDYGLVGKKRKKVIKFEQWLHENGQENITYYPVTANYQANYNPMFIQLLYEETGIGKVVLIVLDSEWLISGENKKLSGTDYGKIREDMYILLQSYLDENLKQGDILLLSMHHPLYSMGHHGMEEKLKQDVHNGRYAEMAKELQKILLTTDARTIIASGHEHIIQIIDTPNPKVIQIFSGAGSKSSDLEDLDNRAHDYAKIYKGTKIRFASDAIGYVSLSFYVEDNVIKVESAIINAQPATGEPKNIGTFAIF